MAMTEQEYKLALMRARAKEADWNRRFKMHLNDVYNVGGRGNRALGSAVDTSRSMARQKLMKSPNWGLMTKAERERALYYAGSGTNSGIVHQSGKAFGDKDFKMAVEASGGNPFSQMVRDLSTARKNVSKAIAQKYPTDTQQPVQGKASSGKNSSYGGRGRRDPLTGRLLNVKRQEALDRRKEEDKGNLLQKFFDEAQAKQDEANAANESRYQDILGRREDTRGRVMDRVENFGIAARADLDERAAESLSNIQANLAGRGMGNSTIFSAFQQRNARDLAREQQRLSERVDARAANYDLQTSGGIQDFMERRTDAQPDLGRVAQLAQQYGLSNDGRGFNDNGGQNAQQQPVEAVQPPAQPYAPAGQVSYDVNYTQPQQNITFGRSSYLSPRSIGNAYSNLGFVQGAPVGGARGGGGYAQSGASSARQEARNLRHQNRRNNIIRRRAARNA